MFKLILIVSTILGAYLYLNTEKLPEKISFEDSTPEIIQKVIPDIAPKVTLFTPPQSKTLPGGTHVFQSYNNCGPAALSMALSYYGINKTQQELGEILRPYQVPSGDNDDKSVTLKELAERSRDFGFTPYLRPNGDIEKIKLFITYDIPVITRTWLKENDDIGHYRVIKGYQGDLIIQDDSLQGKNLRYTKSEFDSIWKKFNYEYLVLVPEDKVEIAEAILGEDLDERRSWEKATQLSKKQLLEDPGDIYARFNLSVAYHNTGDYQRSIQEYEQVENKLPFRTLWYQIEPVNAYFQIGDYQKVLQITQKVLNYHNRAYSEAYILRGDSYLKLGDIDAAKEEYKKAVIYNKNLQIAKDKLNSL